MEKKSKGEIAAQVKYVVDALNWAEDAPYTMLGTFVWAQVWEHLAEIVEGSLWDIGAERDENGEFVCYEEGGGPKRVLEAWLATNCGTGLAGGSGD